MNQSLVVACSGFIAAALLGQTPADSRQIVISAADLAPPEHRAEQPSPGKWWFKRDTKDWGAANGILMTGKPSEQPSKAGEWTVPAIFRFVPYRVPGLVVDPKASGWHKIYIGLYHERLEPVIQPQLFGRLSREPYPEYLRTPQFNKEHTAEVYWKAADLTGQKIHLDQPPAPMPYPGYGWVGGVTHLRLVPMTEAEVAAAKKEIELPPFEHRLFGMLDYPDEVFWYGTVESADDIRAIVYRHKQAGFGRVYWRAFGTHLDHSTAVAEAAPRWTDADDKRWRDKNHCQAGWMAYINLTKKFDPLQVAVEYGKKNDCEVHAWVRLTNFNREPLANFWHDHPEFSVQMLARQKDPKTGQAVPIVPYKRSPYRRVLSFAYPEVRAFYVKFFQHIASTGTRGILIDLLRHPPIAGYEPIVTEAFKKKYGMDMETRDVYHDPLVQEHLSEYLRLFLVDLRKAIGKDIEISVRCSGPSKFALRGQEFIAEGLIDAIIDGNWYSGNGPRPTIADTVKAAGSRGKAMVVAEPWDVDPKKGYSKREGRLSPQAIAAFVRHYSGKGVASFGLYESTEFTWDPELRRAVRAAGWSFHP